MRNITTEDLERANIPARYWTAVSLKGIPKAASYRRTVQRYFAKFDQMQTDGIGLFLWSELNGTGKTSIAVVAAMWALANGRSTFYYRSEDLKEATISRTPFSGGATVYDRARDVDFLVLDDLGKEYKGQSGFIESVVENLLRERIQRRRVTFITSNIDPADLPTVFSRDVTEVLKEAVFPVEIGGPKMGGKLWRQDAARRLEALLEGDE